MKLWHEAFGRVNIAHDIGVCPVEYGMYSYGLCRYGLHGYGIYSYGATVFGRVNIAHDIGVCPATRNPIQEGNQGGRGGGAVHPLHMPTHVPA